MKGKKVHKTQGREANVANGSNHKLYDRIHNDASHKQFLTKWLVNLETQDLSKAAMSITNGWMSEYYKNQWYADRLAPGLSVFAYDSRGQGESPKEGELNAVQGAIDANVIVTKAFAQFDELAKKQGVKPGKKIMQGNCIGTMMLSSLFAGKLPLSKKIDGTIMISPVSTFSLPRYLKPIYFLPVWSVELAIKHIAPKLIGKVAPGKYSQNSRSEAGNRLAKIIPKVAVKQTRQIFWKENVSKNWSKVNVPSLILVSRSDPLVKIEHSYDAFHKLPYPIWMELNAPDHLILEENIDYLAKMLPMFSEDPWAFYEENKDRSPETGEIVG